MVEVHVVYSNENFNGYICLHVCYVQADMYILTPITWLELQHWYNDNHTTAEPLAFTIPDHSTGDMITIEKAQLHAEYNISNVIKPQTNA